MRDRVLFGGRCLTWHLRFPAALKHVDVGCKFGEIRISLSAAQRHSKPRAVLLHGCLSEGLGHGTGHGVLRHATSTPVLLGL
jgi:hypothetical protein